MDKAMNNFEKRLNELGIMLPSLPTPIANYVPAKRVGNLIYTAGQVSSLDGYEYKGKLGDNVNLDEARAATRACAINCLAAIKSVTGSLNHIMQNVGKHTRTAVGVASLPMDFAASVYMIVEVKQER